MISPSPTQQPPAPQPEQKKVSSTPIRPRVGQTPTALFIKSIFRPIFKGIYYLFRWIGGHKLITLALILVVLASSVITTYVTTRALPFASNDSLKPIAAYDQGSADHIKAWLDALQNGNAAKLNALQAIMVQTSVQPDTQSLVSRYGQPQTGQTWIFIKVLGVHTGTDPGLDSFVEVDLSAPGGGSTISSVLLIHFTTVPALGGRIFAIDVMTPRQIIM